MSGSEAEKNSDFVMKNKLKWWDQSKEGIVVSEIWGSRFCIGMLWTFGEEKLKKLHFPLDL